jgi:NAD(P)-dependent dehydrogenase (short-subunit alcohol dehydrogenase family)
MELADKRVLVTGANRGLGRALVLACAAAGASDVLAGARRPEEVENFVSADDAQGTHITPVRLAVTSDEDVRTVAELGRVDVLINSAGIAVYGGVLKAELADVRREIEVNYFGVLRMVRACAPAMIAHGDGLIVNVASILGKVSLPMLGTYCATKAALLALSQALRGDLSERGVRVITVVPGTIDTDMSRAFAGPKMSATQAAAEIVEAMRRETVETLIGDEAREIFAGLKADPLAMEQAFAQHRA